LRGRLNNVDLVKRDHKTPDIIDSRKKKCEADTQEADTHTNNACREYFSALKPVRCKVPCFGDLLGSGTGFNQHFCL
jgi:hypothetical protein